MNRDLKTTTKLSFKNTSNNACRSCISFPSKLHQTINRNNVDFSLIKIALNKARPNDVNIPLIEITSKKYVEAIPTFFSLKLSQRTYDETT